MVPDMASRNDFLPVNAKDMKARGWDAPDFVFVSGDAYVDHPSFGAAVISRQLEAQGYAVAMLAQPQYDDERDFRRFGKPKLGFLISSGVIDSMVNHYTVAGRKRSKDVYSPGGKTGLRPDRAAIVYSQLAKRAYPDVPVILGGIEASLRRFAHYDYWEDRVRRSILVDSGADILVYGMGERSALAVADALKNGRPMTDIPGTAHRSDAPAGFALFSHQDVLRDKRKYALAFRIQSQEADALRGKTLCQKHGKSFVVVNPPDRMLSPAEMDAAAELPYARAWHPDYDKQGGVPALEEVRFSVLATRGCFGSCNFCALTYHQGRVAQARSHESVLREIEGFTRDPLFKGYVHDVGGPTANFRRPACKKQTVEGACADKLCMGFSPCKAVRAKGAHREFVELLRKIRAIPGVKKAFIRSGLRYDFIAMDEDSDFLREIASHHVSGQLKIAPEHIDEDVLRLMNKPPKEALIDFARRFDAANQAAGLEQYIVAYFMSSHPGSTVDSAIALAEFLRDTGIRSEQVQDFYPTPGTMSTAMFYTGLDPRTMKPVYVPRDKNEKARQRALLQYYLPQNRALVRRALREAGREDLIGFGRHCLVPPESTQKTRKIR